jgi:hypothetical protein
MEGVTPVPDGRLDDVDGFDLAMPFVTVASQGGPHDDESFCAGWEMGVLSATLEAASLDALPVRRTVRAANVPQADLIAQDAGLVQRIVSYAQGHPDVAGSWCVVEFDTPSGEVSQ